MSWGPLIHGHAPKGLLKALAAAAARGTSFGAPTELETRLGAARRDADAVDGARAVRQLGHRSGDERGPRRARGDEARQDRQVRGLLSRARRRVPGAGGLGRDDARRADQPGRPGGGGGRHAARALQRPRRRSSGCATRIATRSPRVIVEPIAGNMGVVPPGDGFLARAARRSAIATARCWSSTR